MAAIPGIKYDDGLPATSANCFPVRTFIRQGVDEEADGAWLVAQRAEQRRRFKAILCTKPKTYARIKEERRRAEKQGTSLTEQLQNAEELEEEEERDVPILDGFFLMRHCCVEDPSDLCSVNISGKEISDVKEEDLALFDNVAYVNASENFLPFEAFRGFPILRELEMPLNGLRSIKPNIGNYPTLEVLDISFNNISNEDILTLGLMPNLKVLHLTGNGLRTLPPNMGMPLVDENAKRKKETARFSKLEILLLDDNRLEDVSIFAALAGLPCLKHLNLAKNEIYYVPMLKSVEGMVVQNSSMKDAKKLLKSAEKGDLRSARSAIEHNRISSTSLLANSELKLEGKGMEVSEVTAGESNTTQPGGLEPIAEVTGPQSTPVPDTDRAPEDETAGTSNNAETNDDGVQDSAPTDTTASEQGATDTAASTGQGEPTTSTLQPGEVTAAPTTPTGELIPAPQPATAGETIEPQTTETTVVAPEITSTSTGWGRDQMVRDPLRMSIDYEPHCLDLDLTSTTSLDGGWLDFDISEVNLSHNLPDEELSEEVSLDLIDESHQLPPFPDLRALDLSYNKIEDEEALLAVAAWPMLVELIIHGNPLTKDHSGDPPLLQRFLGDRLGISIKRREESKIVKPTVQVKMKKSRKVSSVVPAIPKMTVEDLLMLEAPKPPMAPKPPAYPKGISSIDRQSPLPPIPGSPAEGQRSYSGSRTGSRLSTGRSGYSQASMTPTTPTTPMTPVTMDQQTTQDTDAFFMTQVDNQNDEGEVTEGEIKTEKGKKPHLKKTGWAEEKYRGYEILLNAVKDPNYHPPKDMHGNIKALKYALGHELVYRDPAARLDRISKPVEPYRKEDLKRAPRVTQLERKDTILKEMRNRVTTDEAPLDRVLYSNRKGRGHAHNFMDGGRLLSEIQRRYNAVRVNSMKEARDATKVIEGVTEDVVRAKQSSESRRVKLDVS